MNVKKAKTVDGMVDMKAVVAAIAEIPQAFTEVVDSRRKCVLERDTQQVMGLERGKGIVQRFRYCSAPVVVPFVSMTAETLLVSAQSHHPIQGRNGTDRG